MPNRSVINRPTRTAVLILDALRGDATLFARSDEVAAAWRFVEPILKTHACHCRPEPYAVGSWGPKKADTLLGSNRRWQLARMPVAPGAVEVF